MDKIDLIGEFVKNLEGLQREPGPASSQSPFSPIFTQIWAFLRDILTEFPQLERLTEASTRVIKQGLKIVPTEF